VEALSGLALGEMDQPGVEGLEVLWLTSGDALSVDVNAEQCCGPALTMMMMTPD